MRKTYIIQVIVFILSFTLLSCDKFFDVQPKGKVIPVTTKDYDGMMADPTMSNNAYPLVDICSDHVEMQPAAITSMGAIFIGKTYFLMDSFFNETEDDQIWNNCYSAIYKCNVVIRFTPESKEGTDAEKRRVVAEAKVNRAYYYWFLHSNYSKAYNKTTADKDLSVPLLTEPNLEVKAVRATADKVVASIIDDLVSSVDDLPVVGVNKYRVTKASALALLARVYLYVNEYEKAAKEALSALALNNKLVDFRTFRFVSDSRPFSGVVNKPNPIDSPEVLFYRDSKSGTVNTSFGLSSDLEAIYQKYPTDLRYKFHYTGIQMSGVPVPDNIKRFIFKIDYNIGVPEMMLIVAENYARKGDIKALDYLNDLRVFRFLTADYRPLTGSGKDALLNLVLEERQRELPMTGLRWFDMKRLAEEGLYTKTIVRTFQGVEIKLEPKSNRYLFPLAPKLLAINPGLIQNPR